MVEARKRLTPAALAKGTGHRRAALQLRLCLLSAALALAACHRGPDPSPVSQADPAAVQPIALGRPITVEIADTDPAGLPVPLHPAEAPPALPRPEPVEAAPMAMPLPASPPPIATPAVPTAAEWPAPPPPPPPPIAQMEPPAQMVPPAPMPLPVPPAAAPVYRIDGIVYPSMVEAKTAMDRKAAAALATVPPGAAGLPSMLVVIPTPHAMDASYASLPKNGPGSLTRAWLNLMNQRQAELCAQAVRRSGLFSHVTIITSDDVTKKAFYGNHYKMVLGFFPEPGWRVSDVHGVQWFVPAPPTGSFRSEHLQTLLAALQTAVTAMGVN